MATFHHTTKIIGRSQGRSSVAAAAYRSAEKLFDERQCRTQDYSAKSDVVHSEIMLPEGAPVRFMDRELLWNTVEAGEHRRDSQLAREVEVSIPRELREHEAIQLARDYVRETFVNKGMIADLNVHWGQANDGKAQPHMHVMLTMRHVGPDGFGTKAREWNVRALATERREEWSKLANERLAELGHTARIDHRSLVDQGITDREPLPNIGAMAMRMEERGQKSDRTEEHRAVVWRNDARADLLAAGTDVIVGPGETVRSVLDGIRASVNAEAAERDRDRDTGLYRGR
jgi:ATP-dependent exoDNAse (exonuclease V) alpha subunit